MKEKPSGKPDWQRNYQDPLGGWLTVEYRGSSLETMLIWAGVEPEDFQVLESEARRAFIKAQEIYLAKIQEARRAIVDLQMSLALKGLKQLHKREQAMGIQTIFPGLNEKDFGSHRIRYLLNRKGEIVKRAISGGRRKGSKNQKPRRSITERTEEIMTAIVETSLALGDEPEKQDVAQYMGISPAALAKRCQRVGRTWDNLLNTALRRTRKTKV